MSEVAYAKAVLDGNEYLLKFGFNAVADLEDKYDKPIHQILDEEKISFTTLRALYWAGMKWKMPGITIPQVGQMLEKELEAGQSLKDLFEPVGEALKRTKMFKKQGGTVEAEGEPEKNE